MIQRTAKHPGLKSIVQLIAQPLDDSMQLLARYMQNEIPFVDQVLHHGNLLSGKRIRPTLLLLVAGCLGRIDRRHIALAASIEMIHTATLVHDDILDGADRRRHLPTVHCKWNNSTAVLLGDYLFSNAFYLASTTDSARACRLIGNSTNQVCEGELQQLFFENDFDLSQDQYLEIILGKTGRLIACAAELGTFFQSESQAEDHGLAGAMQQFGGNLGIAFQIHDDLLDVVGNSLETGKTLGTDIANQKATLPVIRSLNVLDEEPRRKFVSCLQSPDPEHMEQAVEMMRQVGAIDYAKIVANEYAHKAAAALDDLPENKYRSALFDLVHFAVQRVS